MKAIKGMNNNGRKNMPKKTMIFRFPFLEKPSDFSD
jgi:hypothetical protein